MVKDTTFYTKHTLNCGGKLLAWQEPIVMGILNLTPDSFYDGNKFRTENEISDKISEMISEGATIIDLGGASSRPGATEISEQEELDRVMPVLEKVVFQFPKTFFSIDTFRAKVAEEAVKKGAHIINDISGGSDEKMFATAAKLNVPYVLMHMQGTPKTMQVEPNYQDVVKEITEFFESKINSLKTAGVKDIVLDPGFGFGKNLEHNYTLLHEISYFNAIFDLPVLAGLSRKSMINNVLHTKAAEALNGTSVLHTIALMNGASILRVHDVKQAVECIKLTTY